MGKIKIGYFADGPWAYKAFEKLIQDETIEICFIVPRTDSKDYTLKELAFLHQIDYLDSIDVNSNDFFAKAITYECDLFVSMSFNQIFKSQIINAPKLKTINCHAGKLPFYRGRNVLNWVLINDEKEFGITVHFIDEGIDTGDIILQRTYPITDSDNYNTLLERAYDGCSLILFEAVKQIQDNSFNRVPQKSIHPVGLYCGRRGIGDEVIDWNSNSRDLFNFIRAISSPGPISTTYLNGDIIKISRAEMVQDAPIYINTPGQLLAKSERGFYIKTKDSFIEISEIETKRKLKIGDKLGR
jgi:methionyl-tRNA formyltransferase